MVFFATSGETDLWSNVIRGSTESSCGSAFKYALFAHAKVCQFTVTVFVKKNIVQFQIPAGKTNREKTEKLDK